MWLAGLLAVGPWVQNCSAQENTTDSLNQKRLNHLIIASAATYTITMVALNEVWYKNYPHQPFTFFNDSEEWMQVDKAGHFYAAFQLSDISSRALQWTGLSKKKSNNIGALSSFVMMTSIELFDAYSSGYGASGTDILANTLGISFYIGQQLLWEEIRIQPKFSFHTTHYSNLRPDVLGNTFNEKLLKDYNGQTYWLSVDMDKFIRFPKWINLAAGYGAENFIFASKDTNQSNGYMPYRQYYLSLDIDLSGIKTKSKALKTVLYFVNMIKLPSPTIEFSKEGVKAYPFYF